MEERTFFEILDRCVDDGCLEFVQDERRVRVGCKESPPDAVIRIKNPRFYKRVLASGNLGMGEAFMDHDFEMERGTVADFIAVLLRNRLDKKFAGAMTFRIAARLLWIRLINRVRGRRAAISSHYDYDDDSLFEAFLDSRMIYSCGYVKDPAGTIDEFQRDKLQRICEKLRLQPGERLIDLGCGYGGLLIYAAQNFGISGKGCTLGRRHYERARTNVAAAGLSDRIEIQLAPYDQVSGTFDKLVSVEMIEHLRPREYGRFVDAVARLLHGKGMGLVHYIACTERRNSHDPFIQKYLLPDSSQPKLSEVVAELEERDMAVLDVENLVTHYGHTLRAWADAFVRNSERLGNGYDDRFKRMWLYYLECAAAASFASAGALYQVVFARNYPPQLPLQRV
ncbi:MAG TPA: class I SAM-dependent methyltransferase [Thermoanaerobaculia bacterium]|nr:class I SAM-dependent methyltransferase [Thermoanaerobaculia bacterium]